MYHIIRGGVAKRKRLTKVIIPPLAIIKNRRKTIREARPLLLTILPKPATPIKEATTQTLNTMIPHPYRSLSPNANCIVAVLLEAPTRRRLVDAATKGWRPRSSIIGPKIMPPAVYGIVTRLKTRRNSIKSIEQCKKCQKSGLKSLLGVHFKNCGLPQKRLWLLRRLEQDRFSSYDLLEEASAHVPKDDLSISHYGVSISGPTLHQVFSRHTHDLPLDG